MNTIMKLGSLTLRFSISLIYVAALCTTCSTASSQQSEAIRIVLAGDSTVTDDSGWGKGFAELLNESAECINMAKSGRSSRSFRSEGWWQKCIESKPTYLLIQFGHNDQPGKGPERESDAKTAFRDHLSQFVSEARQAKIQPVLVTSLTRRRWLPDDKIEPTLAEYSAATIAVAKELNVPLVDLHALSIAQCEQIGSTAFRAFEPMDEKGADHTHLNLEGSRAVAPLVAKALIEVVPELKSAFSTERIQQNAFPRPHATRLLAGDLKLEETTNAITVSYRSKNVLTYNKISPPVPEGINPVFQRSGFLHPVSSPNGTVVTAAFPFDHAHQHGIFTAWVKTKWLDREIDFWNLAKGSGRVLHQRVNRTFADERSVGFEVDLVHRSQKEPVVDILRDRWTVVVYQPSEQHFQFDLHFMQTALTNNPIEIAKYHYGGLGYRGPIQWLSPKDGEGDAGELKKLERDPFDFYNDAGQERIAGNAKPTRWVTATGISSGKPVTTIVLSHRDNFRAPQAARLHPTKPYFAFSPCVEDSFTIDSKHPYEARYRYLIMDGQPDAKWIQAQWDAW